jgi:hypothetical protein
MTKITLFAFLFLSFLGCLNVSAQQTAPRVKFTEITFGTATSTTVLKEDMANSPSGDHSVVANQVFTKKTDKIEAKKGVEFGVEYKLTSNKNDTARLDIEWIFPTAMTDLEKKTSYKSLRYPIDMPLNSINASTYGLENDFEVIKGTWQLNIYYAGKMIYARKFELY